jgi:hypothetical protein
VGVGGIDPSRRFLQLQIGTVMLASIAGQQTNQEAQGFVEGWPYLILRLEGLAVAITATVAYGTMGADWLIFALLFFAPDLSFAGYLANPRIGAATYNAVHTSVVPIALGFAAYVAGWPMLVKVTLIWIAHIGFDRALGYGLKYSTAFSDTHLGFISSRRGR